MQQGFELWLIRNQQNNETADISPVHTQLNAEIEELYQHQHEVMTNDRGLFGIPIEERYQLTAHQKKAWISETKKTVKYSEKEYQQKMSSGQQDIRTYFTKQGKSQ